MALKPRSEQPNAGIRGQMIARLVALGYRSQDLANIIRANRNRGEMANDLIALQRQAPKETARR